MDNQSLKEQVCIYATIKEAKEKLIKQGVKAQLFARKSSLLLTESFRTPDRDEKVVSACAYTNLDGNNCGAGLLLEQSQLDEIKEKSLNISTISTVMDRLGWKDWNGHKPGIVQKIQRIHDQNDPSQWEHKFEHLTKEVRKHLDEDTSYYDNI